MTTARRLGRWSLVLSLVLGITGLGLAPGPAPAAAQAQRGPAQAPAQEQAEPPDAADEAAAPRRDEQAREPAEEAQIQPSEDPPSGPDPVVGVSRPAPEPTCREVAREAGSASEGAPLTGGGKQLPPVRVNSLALDVTIRDANPLFFPGNENAWATGDGIYPSLAGPTSLAELDYDQARKLGARRIGVAADGASQLLLIVSASGPGTIRLQTAPAAPDGGHLHVFREGRTCDLGDRHVALALYTAPRDFGRGSGMRPPRQRVGQAEARTVRVAVSFLPRSSLRQVHRVLDLEVVRPPVVLVHGLFDNAVDAWLTPATNGETLPYHMEKLGFIPFLVDYEPSNGRGGQPSSFHDNRHVVWTDGATSFLTPRKRHTGATAPDGGIRRALAHYRDELEVAATQADVIGHSMGGILPRVNASVAYNARYLRPDNFGRGDIYRLVTIDTPHHGSGQPRVFELLTLDNIPSESPWATFARTLARHYALWVEAVTAGSPAMQDLKLRSRALRRIGQTTVPSHVVVSVTATLKDRTYDETGRYLKETAAVAAMFYFFPEILDRLVADMARDWRGTPWEDRFPEAIRQAYGDLIAAEAEHWAGLQREGLVNSWLFEAPVTAPLVPHAVVEALRSLMFRFDKNDSTVRLESQLGGLALDSGAVTYAALERDPAVKGNAHVPESVFHSFAQRHLKIQLRVIDVLKSGPARFSALPAAGRSMKGRAPPEILGVDWRVTGDPAIAWSGMDPRHAQAFLDVAARDNVVILTRPVNPDATALIAAGAATKSMNVKGKSSNWGPQKGYIPVSQRYSKLWRAVKNPNDRDGKIREFDGRMAEMLAAEKPIYRGEKGEPIAVGRQLEHYWCPDTRSKACPEGERTYYSVWVDPDDADAEAAVHLCQGRPNAGQPCRCRTWYDWRTGTDREFDLKSAPGAERTPAACNRLRPMEVLADNTHPAKPFLTADYDILATGFHCPDLTGSAHAACQAVVKVEDTTRPKGRECGDSTTFRTADYALHAPPVPLPCFDPGAGLITEAQKVLLTTLNQAVAASGYTGGNVTHHGPETQFFESPYVDYPITAFDPSGPDGKPVIISIPKGPEGFRDIHLKRYYERKVRQGYWLYPNTYATANWRWKLRGSRGGKWGGWHYEDDKSLRAADDVEEIDPMQFACVKDELERLARLRRGEPPPPSPAPCAFDAQ